VGTDRWHDIADTWRSERAERFARTGLDPVDFERLRAAGLTMLPVPVEHRGEWIDVATSVRPICEALRILAAADPSPALVSAMHPAVLAFWLANEAEGCAAWEVQRGAVVSSAASGAQWGTVTSEPGSGGDVIRTRSTAEPLSDDDDIDIPGDRYAISGDKHFGSGTGVCSYMFTTAIPAGEEQPAAFFVDTRALVGGGDVPGFTIAKEWDGVGMSATQSHAVRLDGCRAVRLAWPSELEALARGAGAVNSCLFTAVVLGVVDEAVAVADERLRPRGDSLRPYEQVEWVRALNDHWVASQAYEGMLRAVESGDVAAALVAGLRGKTAVAELAEQTLLRIGRVVGGGTFSGSSPFSSWFEDVRALGFLRPPWGLAYDGLLAAATAPKQHSDGDGDGVGPVTVTER
jgi:alkylation response protein AidB-like acyl-CoA dehydrogenase